MAATCLSHVSQSGVLLNCLNKSYQFIRNDHVLKETVSPSKPRGSLYKFVLLVFYLYFFYLY